MSGSVQNKNKEEDIQLIPFFKMCWALFLANLKWFILSVALCLVLGYIYQARKPRVYQRQAVILFEDNDNDNSGGMSRSSRNNGLNTLMQLNGISVGDNLKNEMFILTSERLMTRVVDSLGLDVDYTTSAGLHSVALYTDRPFEIAFQRKTEDLINFEAKIQSDGTVKLSNFVRFNGTTGKKKMFKEHLSVRPGTVVKTPIGNLQINKTTLFSRFPENKAIEISQMPVQMAAKIYKDKISASAYDKETSLVVLSAQDINTARAEDLLNAVYELYKQDVVDNKNRVASSTANFIDKRVMLIGQELTNVENRLASFKQQNSVIDFQEAAGAMTAQSADARQQALQLETQLSVARYLQEFLQNNSNEHQIIPAINLEKATFNGQIDAYNQLMNERNKNAANSSEQSPLVRDLDKQLASQRTSILSSVRSYVRSVEMQANAARSNENSLMGQVNNAPQAARKALDIQRQQNLKETLYTYLLNKREEVALQLAINEANVRMVENPLGPSSPVSPRKVVIMFIAFLIGLIIPAVVLWLRELFDVTISGRQDVEGVVTAPIVGELPRWESPSEDALITHCAANDPIVEAFRMLRFSLSFVRRTAKVMVLTSTTPHHGKSFISRNLSVVFAMANKRVLLIDADIRKRTLSSDFGRTAGLTSWLVDVDNQTRLEDIVVKDSLTKGVDFLPAGILPPNPAELLMSDRLEELVAVAREQYDFIIFDTTPIFGVADASIVDRVADLTLYVMRVGMQEKAFLPELEKMYQDKKMRNLCLILNDSDAKSRKKGYGYGYGYGYGQYGYGYGYGYTQERKTQKLGSGLLGKLRK